MMKLAAKLDAVELTWDLDRGFVAHVNALLIELIEPTRCADRRFTTNALLTDR